MGIKEIWESIRPFLKRFDLYLLLVSLVTLPIVVIFCDQYNYWPLVIVVICVICIVSVTAAIVYSIRSPAVGVWREYATAMTVSIVFLVFVRSAIVFYAYPVLMAVVLLVLAVKGGPGADT